MPSRSVETRSLSPRTVLDKAKDTAASAAEIHSTVSRALPRRPLPVDRKIVIKNLRAAPHVQRRGYRDRLQPRKIGFHRPHLDPDRQRPLPPIHGRPPYRLRVRIIGLIEIGKPAERQPVRQNERSWARRSLGTPAEPRRLRRLIVRNLV